MSLTSPTKTILLTGATDGIGLEVAKTLAQQGHILLLHGRSQKKLEAVCESLSASSAKILPYLADMSDLNEVRAMAERVLSEHDKLDVLINNAGVYRVADPVMEDGQDKRFVVNSIAPYLLTKLLLPILPKDGRVLNLSSAAQAEVSLAALQGKERVADMPAYAQSKLAITMWTNHLAANMPDGPDFISINPGSLLATKMVKEGFGVAGSDISIGSDLLVRAALSEEFSGKSGQYYDNDSRCFAAPQADGADMAKAARIAEVIEGMIGPG